MTCLSPGGLEARWGLTRLLNNKTLIIRELSSDRPIPLDHHPTSRSICRPLPFPCKRTANCAHPKRRGLKKGRGRAGLQPRRMEHLTEFIENIGAHFSAGLKPRPSLAFFSTLPRDARQVRPPSHPELLCQPEPLRLSSFLSFVLALFFGAVLLFSITPPLCSETIQCIRPSDIALSIAAYKLPFSPYRTHRAGRAAISHGNWNQCWASVGLPTLIFPGNWASNRSQPIEQ